MKNIPYKNHHFIPECYLKGFSSDGKKVMVYNKQTSSSYRKAFKNVAFVENLYTVSKKYIDAVPLEGLHEKYFEVDYFAATIESAYNKQLIELRSRTDDWISNPSELPVLTVDDKEALAAKIAIQSLRLPTIKEAYYSGYRKMKNHRLEVIKSMLVDNNETISKEFIQKIEHVHDEDYASVLHATLYTDAKLLEQKTRQLCNKAWAFLISTDSSLFTSDNPIVIIPKKHSSYFLGDFGTLGAQIIFPISGKILLSMWDRNDFDRLKYSENEFQSITKEDLYINNYSQYAAAEMQLYQSADEFDLVANILKSNNGKHVFPNQLNFKVSSI